MKKNNNPFAKLTKIREAILAYTKSVNEIEARLSKTVYQIKSLEQNIKYLTKNGPVPLSVFYKKVLKNLNVLTNSCESLKKILKKEKEKLEEFKDQENKILLEIESISNHNVIYLSKVKK